MWKDFTVRVDAQELGRLQGRKELEGGGAWTLPDGAELRVLLDTSVGGGGLQVTRDGVPLPGSVGDPKTAMTNAASLLYFIAGLNVVLGLVAELAGVELLLGLGLGWATVAFGVVLGGLGFATSRGSIVALWIGIVLFAVDGLLGLYFVVDAGGQPGVGGIVFRVFLVIALVKSAITGKAARTA